MRIVENTNERLVMQGTPGGVRWMVFAALLGMAVMAATGWFARTSVHETDQYFQLVPLGIGFLMGTALLLIGLLTLALGRMRLILDRVTGNGNYDVYSPIIDVGKPCAFRLDAIDGVNVERREETRHGNDAGGSFPAKICLARLRIRQPRRAIVLDETENGQERRVQAVAQKVAEWLELEVTNHR
ncbi:MAG: hypothetical protein AAF961_05015 [Planctomycetota bacterium]